MELTILSLIPMETYGQAFGWILIALILSISMVWLGVASYSEPDPKERISARIGEGVLGGLGIIVILAISFDIDNNVFQKWPGILFAVSAVFLHFLGHAIKLEPKSLLAPQIQIGILAFLGLGFLTGFVGMIL